MIMHVLEFFLIIFIITNQSKEIADDITDSNDEDGVAIYLERYL